MRKLWFLSVAALSLLAMVNLSQAQSVTINGAGASFPYPVYSQWAHKYHELSGVKINYQSIGSGGGIAQIKAKTVDFGGTDEPLKPEDLEKSGLIQFPTVMGGVVTVLNVPGIESGKLKLDGPTLADIFMGKISKWDDAAIKKLNPDVKLPSQAITVAHRTDGSGTTFIFTSYLAAVSPEFKEKVGAGKAVKWPAANSIGGKGNEGVANMVAQTDGAIGYVEYAYAKQNKMTYTKMINKDGKTVSPSGDSFQAAAANADWAKAKGFYLILANQPGADSWPMTAATFIIMYKKSEKTADDLAALKFFDWAYKNGGKMADELDYVPMPATVVDMVEKTWVANIKDASGAPLWK